ncbi:MAG TPA: hypothetical protein VMV49_08980 [Candidatus Deferrimicrobium sp.]|nr:hypothetical protein [Candidatus Deferrimicrobium sp.]
MSESGKIKKDISEIYNNKDGSVTSQVSRRILAQISPSEVGKDVSLPLPSSKLEHETVKTGIVSGSKMIIDLNPSIIEANISKGIKRGLKFPKKSNKTNKPTCVNCTHKKIDTRFCKFNQNFIPDWVRNCFHYKKRIEKKSPCRTRRII